MPSSLAADGLGTSAAVRLTSSSSPSREASNSNASGSKLTRRGAVLFELGTFKLPFFRRRDTAEDEPLNFGNESSHSLSVFKLNYQILYYGMKKNNSLI